MTPIDDESSVPNEGERLDLELENRSLETEIKLRGGVQGYTSEDIDPVIENQFLKHVLEFEEMDKEPKRPMRSLFPADYEFPPVGSLSPDELSRKIDDIADILEDNGIAIGLSDELPDALVYTYLTEEVIPRDEVFPQHGAHFTLTLDGCTGACDVCFQREYCETGREINAESGEAPDRIGN